jgi:hypothetical protein
MDFMYFTNFAKIYIKVNPLQDWHMHQLLLFVMLMMIYEVDNLFNIVLF